MDANKSDRKKAAELARQVGIDFGAAMTVALAYLGDRLGIFRVLASGVALTTSELAAKTGLNERYVREWAATMAAAGYVDYSPAEAKFRMTPAQAMVLANEDTTFFTAGAFQYAVTCYRQLGRLMSAFQHGGGVPFADFGLEIVEAIERLFHVGYETWVADQWIPAVADIQQQLEHGGDAAEVGCGAGQCLIPVALAFPKARFYGYDVDARSLERAREKAGRAGIGDRLSFEQIAAESLAFEERFDLVMAFNCIHDMARPRAALAGLRRVLKPHGALLWSEAKVSDRLEDNLTPFGRTVYGASTMHCLTVSLAQHGEGLGSAIGENQARSLAAEAGFATFEKLSIENPYHHVFLARP
jgi:SAM-dependent methyltransferase